MKMIDRMLVIKFEDGYRLVRRERVIEAWLNGRKLAQYLSWGAALAFLDMHAGHDVEPEKQPVTTH